MIRELTPAEYETVLRQHFSTFAARCFYDLNSQTELAMNWHLEVIAAKLSALVGHVLAQEPWEVVCFPAIAEDDEVHEVDTIFGPRTFTRRRGEALHPEREPLETLDRLRRTLGE